MLILRELSYLHPNRDLLFENINLTLHPHEKVALIGSNGIGKSTLLKILAKELAPAGGEMIMNSDPYYIPQIFGQFDHLTIAQALRIENKLIALQEILNGEVTASNLSLLQDDWTIEQRCAESLSHWQLNDLVLTQKMGTISGGQKARVFLAGISIHEPDFLLLDEPSNHLDSAGRELLYDLIRNTSSTLMVISHDRKLLNLLDTVCEMTKRGIMVYGGNYDFYREQKEIETYALNQEINSTEKALRKAKEKERQSIERQQKLDSRGKKKQEKAGVAKIMMNTLRNKAENSTSKLKSVHAEKVEGISQDLNQLRSTVRGSSTMKFGFDNSGLHKGKLLFKASAINYCYGNMFLWKHPLDCEIGSGERIALKGLNGSGKTTLIRIILGELEPQSGKVYRAENKSVYIDQDYSLIKQDLKVYEQAQAFNISGLQEHEVKIRLNRFLFTKDDWDKPCSALSGGEKMRLMLCCLTIHSQSPDIIILDEPTNNLDIENIEILTAAINEYEGTLIVVSHDEYFLKEINIGRTLNL